MDPLQLTVTSRYKVHHARTQATYWDMQNKATTSSQISIFFVSDVPVGSLRPAWWILYHVAVSCKGPIATYLQAFANTCLLGRTTLLLSSALLPQNSIFKRSCMHVQLACVQPPSPLPIFPEGRGRLNTGY